MNQLGEEIAEKTFEEYWWHVIDFDKDTIKEATRFWIKHRKRNISMTDCIGYILAKRLDIKFLTGDKEFEDLENVEFVK